MRLREQAQRDLTLAAECLLAARRGEDSEEGMAGAMLEAETFARIRAFLTPE